MMAQNHLHVLAGTQAVVVSTDDSKYFLVVENNKLKCVLSKLCEVHYSFTSIICVLQTTTDNTACLFRWSSVPLNQLISCTTIHTVFVAICTSSYQH